MPSFACRWPTCTAYIADPGYCPEHAVHAPADRREQHRRYDQTQRDPESKKFYDSSAWQAARRQKLEATPLCELCGRFAAHIHHKVPLRECRPNQRTEQANLQALCGPCHSKIEAEG